MQPGCPNFRKTYGFSPYSLGAPVLRITRTVIAHSAYGVILGSVI